MRDKVRTGVTIAIVCAVLLLVFQNTESVNTRFLFFSLTMPRAAFLFLSLAVGFLAGMLFAHRRRK